MCSSGYTGKYCETKVSWLCIWSTWAIVTFTEGRGTSTAVLGWMIVPSILNLMFRHFGWVVHAYGSVFPF